MAPKQPLNLIQFQKTFSTEEACYQHMYQIKWPEGFHCPKCGHDQAYEIKTRKQPLYECTECKHQTTLKVGTVFEKSRTDLAKWFWAIFLIAHDKRGVSATFLADELGIAYQTAWTMQHKIRKAMSKRDSMYSLAGIVELDEAFFGAPTEGGKRGRGTEQTPVLVALSLRKGHNPWRRLSTHLQAYLDEFCYRFNRRIVKNQLFNRLVQCCLSTTVVTYPELVG